MRSRFVLTPSIIFAFSLAALLLLFYGNSLWQLFCRQSGDNRLKILTDPYIRHIIIFSFYQAFLSALISIIGGLLTAHAFFYHSFFGKRILLKLFSLTMVLPALVVIFGILSVYGNSGWLSLLLQQCKIGHRINIYGLSGILLAHVFFNLPLATKVFLHSLHSIPNQQRKLAAQLGIIDFNFIRLIEWYYLRRQLLPTFSLIFMLCFTSFAIVLTLGGGPKYSTLEVAVYQAIMFNFQLDEAAIYALLQFGFCLLLFSLSNLFTRPVPTQANIGTLYFSKSVKWLKYTHRIILACVIPFICLPLLATCLNGLNFTAWKQSLTSSQLYTALAYSLSIAPLAGNLSIFIASILLLGARRLQWQNKKQLSSILISSGMMILAIPALVLAVGIFLFLQQFSINTPILFLIVVICNSLMTLPFVLRILTVPFMNNMIYYEQLCQSLGIYGLSRFRHIEWNTIKQPLKSAFALASGLSLGDFTIISLFGNENFNSLPRLLYLQLGSYKMQEGAVTALILLLFCMLLFYIIEDGSKEIYN